MFLSVTIAVLVCTIGWEHFAKNINVGTKPSVFLKFLVSWANWFYEWLGIQFGRLSSFITYLKIEELFDSIKDVMVPLFDFLIVSPFYFFKGYFLIVCDYKWPILIFIGSFVILDLVVWGILWLKRKYYDTTLHADEPAEPQK